MKCGVCLHWRVQGTFSQTLKTTIETCRAGSTDNDMNATLTMIGTNHRNWEPNHLRSPKKRKDDGKTKDDSIRATWERDMKIWNACNKIKYSCILVMAVLDVATGFSNGEHRRNKRRTSREWRAWGMPKQIGKHRWRECVANRSMVRVNNVVQSHHPCDFVSGVTDALNCTC